MSLLKQWIHGPVYTRWDCKSASCRIEQVAVIKIFDSTYTCQLPGRRWLVHAKNCKGFNYLRRFFFCTCFLYLTTATSFFVAPLRFHKSWIRNKDIDNKIKGKHLSVNDIGEHIRPFSIIFKMYLNLYDHHVLKFRTILRG